MDYKVSYVLSLDTLKQPKEVIITDCNDPEDAATTVHDDYEHSLVLAIMPASVSTSTIDHKLALSKRSINFLIAYKYGAESDTINYMVVEQCHSKREAVEGFQCLYSNSLTVIVSIEIWNGKPIGNMIIGCNNVPLQELREYRDNAK